MRIEDKTMAPPNQTLATWRETMGLTQKQAAEALGCARNSIIEWEQHPENTPRYIKLAAAALALGIEAE